MHSCRPQGATLRDVRSLKHTEICPADDISYVIRMKARCSVIRREADGKANVIKKDYLPTNDFIVGR